MGKVSILCAALEFYNIPQNSSPDNDQYIEESEGESHEGRETIMKEMHAGTK